VRFGVLGPVEARAGGGELVVLAAKPRALLAVLLVHAGRPVSRDRLIAALWPDPAPPSARRVVSTYVSGLRASLGLPRHGPLPRLALIGDGYRLEAAPGEVDLQVFGDLAGRGRRTLSDGDAVAAAMLLEQALGLWRGEPAQDVTLYGESALLLAGLSERRLLAEEDRVQAGLALGEDAALIAGLQVLAAAHPLRERPWGLLMTALYRSGRQGEALAAYQRLRARLVAELGAEPGSRLRELHQQMLSGEPLPGTLAAPVVLTPLAVARQLPADVRHFTGRAGELDQLDTVTSAPGTDLPESVVITVISGTAGVGKTALAIRWAHQAARRFPDGQLHASLHGHGPASPADPHTVLSSFLRALGVAPERIPGTPDEAAGLYRSLLDGKKVLILLDNAAGAEQVRPLLPAAAGCLVIVTSRRSLAGLGARDGAIRITLAALPAGEAIQLLRVIIGPGRADAEPDALAAIASQCAYLPLALRIAAERAITRPHHPLAWLAGQLAATREPLDTLAADDDPATSVRAVLSWSYQSLTPDPARMFRLLGLHPGPDISILAAAALAATSRAQAQRLLDELADVHLAEEPAPGRYRLHDLLRAYAAERAIADEDPDGRATALRRVLTWYMHAADAADRMLAPAKRHVDLPAPPAEPGLSRLPDYPAALAWCDAEQANLAAAIEAAASHGEADIAWKLQAAMLVYFDIRQLWATMISCGQAALAAARHAGDARAEARLLSGLGKPYRSLRRYDEALGFLQRALWIRQQTGDLLGEGAVWNNLGSVHNDMGRLDDAIGCFWRALDVAVRIGDQYGESIALSNLAEAYLLLRCPDQVSEPARQAVAIARQIGQPDTEAFALTSLGGACLALGQPAGALEHYQQALTAWQHAGDRHSIAAAHHRLGDLLHDTGHTSQARHHWGQALAIHEQTGDPKAPELRARLQDTASRPPPAATTAEHQRRVPARPSGDADHHQSPAQAGDHHLITDSHVIWDDHGTGVKGL